MENLKYRLIYEYEFHRGTSVTETARKVNDVYDSRKTEKHSAFLVQRFRSSFSSRKFTRRKKIADDRKPK